MPGKLDPLLVALSFAIAVLASWVALDLSGRVYGQQRADRRYVWLAAGSVSMGMGVWSMHYVGMLACRMDMPVLYDWPTVVLSMVCAVVASCVAFSALTRSRLSWAHTGLSSLVMGGGIAGMHFLGMAAMRMPERMAYDAPTVALSVVAAVVISLAALRLTFGLREVQTGWSWKKAGSALLMGVAIPTMHYLGMASARWTGLPGRYAPADLRHAIALSQLSTTVVVTAVVLLLALVLIFANVDRRVLHFESALHGSRRSYAQLLDHNERLQKAFRAGGVGIWECDPATLNFYVDASLRDLYGIAHDDKPVPRDQWKSRVHPEDVKALDERWKAALGASNRYESEYRIVRPDGHMRRVRSVASVLRAESGAVLRVLGMTWDVTAERQREQETAEQGERFRLILESIGDAVVSTDEQQRIIFLNRAATALTGWSAEEAHGRPLYEVFATQQEPSQTTLWDPVTECMRGSDGALLIHDAVLTSRNGTTHNIRGHVALLNASGAAVVTFEDITAWRRMERDLQHAATHDGLTGMLNRGAFERQLRTAWESTRFSPKTHCLCVVDLDRFKIINDTSGHLAGDGMLREVARLLLRSLRSGDVAARMGGDEFLLLLTDCNRHEGESRMKLLLEAIAGLRFPWQGRVYDVTASSGLVLLDHHSPEPEVLVSQADVATFTAKRNGRNQLSVYTDDSSGAAGDHQEMEVVAGLRRSLDQNRFELYAQPIVPIGSPTTMGSFELLIRMRDEQGELVPPDLFVPAAERYGLMGLVDRWVIRAALETYEHHGCGSLKGKTIRFAINLSAESLNDVTLWDYVAEHLQRTRVPPDRITFEVTETGLIGNFDHARQFVDKARQAGCLVALDDFGTGLSSLSYLKQFALDVIKIDGTFIRTLREQPLDQAIIRSIAQIARSMNASIVAECVEERDMLPMLERLGVDYAQGWATGRPKPLPAVLETLLMEPSFELPLPLALGRGALLHADMI